MTIIFQSDWDSRPDAIVDTTTKNVSFIRYAALLKSMGISNHLFCLALHNPELQGIDPLDPSLTLEQQIAVAVECKDNFWYYIREIARAPGSTVEQPLRFKANRGNISAYFLFFCNITFILIQIRQTGKSLSIDQLMIWLLEVRCTDTNINLLTKDDKLRASNLGRLKKLESMLPYYLKARSKGDVGNTEEMSVKALGNYYRAHVPNPSPKMAESVGRGHTSPIWHIDEAAFFQNIALSLPAALAAGTADRDRADADNSPWGTILTTTAGKKDDRDGAFVFNMLMNSAIWSEKFFDCKNKLELTLLIKHATPKGQIRVNCTFNHRQLGYTDEWLRRKILEAEVSGEAADRDFGNVWTAGSTASPIPLHLLTIIRGSQNLEPFIEIQRPYPYVIRWHIPEEQIESEMAGEHHILTIDSSDAAGGDDIGMTIRSIKTGAVTAAGNYNETNIITFSKWLVDLLVKYEKMTLIIERRSTGSSILDYLLLMLPEKGIDPFRRIYNKVVQNSVEFPDRYKAICSSYGLPNRELYVEHKAMFGFATSASGATSRTELYGTTLINAAKLTGSKVHDKMIIDQLLSLVIRNGRVDHPPGGNDDMVISFLLGFWLMTLGQNLQHYGINPRDILVNNDSLNADNDPLSVYEREFQENLKYEIDKIISVLKDERDDYIAQRLENRMKQLNAKLTETDKQTLAVDDLITNIREYRRINRGSVGYSARSY